MRNETKLSVFNRINTKMIRVIFMMMESEKMMYEAMIKNNKRTET